MYVLLCGKMAIQMEVKMGRHGDEARWHTPLIMVTQDP